MQRLLERAPPARRIASCARSYVCFGPIIPVGFARERLGACLKIASYEQGGRAHLAQGLLARNKRRSERSSRCAARAALNLTGAEDAAATRARNHSPTGTAQHSGPVLILWACLRQGQYRPHKRKRPEPVGAFLITARAPYLPSQRLSTRVALVPPKPKLLLMTVSILAFSSVLRRIGRSATSGSSSSMLAEPAMKLFSIISRQ